MTSNASDLLQAILSLEAPRGDGEVYVTIRHHREEPSRFGKDKDGRIAVLIASDSSEDEGVQAPIELANILLRPSCMCTVTAGADTSVSRMTVVKCKSDDARYQECFLRVLSGTLGPFPESRSSLELRRLLSTVAELFRALEEPSQRSIQGLWCELFLIAYSHDIGTAIGAWHRTPQALHDFSRGDTRIEVKSSTGRRVHRFSATQIVAENGTTVLVASFLLQETGLGLTVADLWDRISERCEERPELLAFVNKVVTATLGSAWRYADRIRFSPDSALAQLRVYSASSIPRFVEPFPEGIENVRYDCDMEVARPLSPSELRSVGDLANALFGVSSVH
jgi:hypothetical protein